MTVSINISIKNDNEIYKNELCQIMPLRFGYFGFGKVKPEDNENINKFKDNDKLIVHMSFSTRLWSKINDKWMKMNIMNSLEFFKGKTLIHGPENEDEIERLEEGLKWLDSFVKDKKRLVVEMPAFTKKVYSEKYKDGCYEKVKMYFDEILKYGFSICIDTAHCYANGLSVNMMYKLIVELLSGEKISGDKSGSEESGSEKISGDKSGNEKISTQRVIIHLNGNRNEMFRKDHHIFILNDMSMFRKRCENLLYLIKVFNLDCILELTDEDEFENYEELLEELEEYGMKTVK